jgi:acyl-CoA synthetase (AMP-forming)/AMP-acid ligase II
VAEIVLAEGADAPERKELAAFLRERVPGYKVPREFRVVEALARTVTGKVRRGPGPAARRRARPPG